MSNLTKTNIPQSWSYFIHQLKNNSNYSVPDTFLQDKDFILMCLKHTNFSYTKVPKEVFEQNRDVAYAIISKQKYDAATILELFSLDNYSLDKDIMYYFIRNSTSFYKYADPSLFNERDFCLALSKRNLNNAEKCSTISPHFFSEKDFVLEISSSNQFALNVISSPSILKDKDVLKEYHSHNKFFFLDISEKFYKDTDIALEVIKIICNTPEEIFNNKDFQLHRFITMIERAQCFPDFFQNIDFASVPPLNIIKNLETLYSHLQMKNDLENQISAPVKKHKPIKF